jgi:hypothetical protein
LSRLVFTLAAVAALAGAIVVSKPPAHTARAAPAADVLPAPLPTTQWSPPASLSACPASPAARVVFPSDKPSNATGEGAIVWSASSACLGGAGARVAPLGAGDVPRASLIPRTAAGQITAPRGQITASGAPHGQIVIAGTSPSAADGGLLIQGRASGPFSPLQTNGGSAAPIALDTAYLGDVALAASPTGPHASGALNVHVERFFSHRFMRNVSAHAPGGGPVHTLTLAMDFRGEALTVWAQHGAIYARLLPNRGTERPLQRLAPVGSDPRIAALLSDDNRAIVAWAEQSATQTSIYIDRSATGVRFGKPELLERFRDPDGLASPAGSPSLVRLSSESVLLAWAGSDAGHWVIRTAPVSLNGVLNVSTIAAPSGDALLADLAPGPDDDALLLWTEPLPTASDQPDMQRQAIFAARGTEVSEGRASFSEPEQVAAPGPVSDATVAFDPDSDRAVAAWQGEAATIEYSIRRVSAGP